MVLAPAPLGVCPSCGATLDLRRIFASEVYDSYAAPGVDTEVWFWIFKVSCAGCLSAVTVKHGFNGQEVSLATPGTVVVRLRERLSAARTGGSLLGELESLSLEEWILLGTPELFAEIADAHGRRLRLIMVAVHRCPEASVQPPVDGVSPMPCHLDPAPEDAKPTKKKTKAKKPRRAPAPVSRKKEEILPAGTALQLLAIHNGRLLCECPSEDGRKFLVYRTLVERAD